MDEKGFRKFLKAGKQVPPDLPPKVIGANVRVAKEFEQFLKARGSKKGMAGATEKDIRAFVKHLSKDGKNEFDYFLGLLRYSRLSGNDKSTLAVLVTLDGANILDELCKTVEREHGKAVYKELLGDFEPPGIGTSPKLMPKVTTDFMDRLEKGLGGEATRQILLTGPHAAPAKHHAEERKMFLESKDVDEYLEKRRKVLTDLLQSHMDSGTMFYTQRINKEVMDFLRANPEVQGGVRKGGKIYHTKIPYMAIEYLREEDPKLRRYYYCHCPLARESILTGKQISRNLCYCSAGYEKRPFDVAFDTSIKAKVLKSVLWGDDVCRFALEIPEECLKKKRRASARGRSDK